MEYNKIRKKFGLKQISKKDLISSEGLYLETLNGVKNGIKNYETFLIIDSKLKNIQNSFFYKEISSNSYILGYSLSEFIKKWNNNDLDLTPKQLEIIENIAIPQMKDKLEQSKINNVSLFLGVYLVMGEFLFIGFIFDSIFFKNEKLKFSIDLIPYILVILLGISPIVKKSMLKTVRDIRRLLVEFKAIKKK